MSDADNKLSTSALARKLELPVQQLFATLKDYGWIERRGDSWSLTSKGEYEGGSYRKSSRFGTYIVWPESVQNNALVSAIEQKKRITAAGMQRYYSRLHARHINRALAELGLQHHSILGWELTEYGKRLGGQQEESENTGAYYVTWPHEIVDHPVIHRELTLQSDKVDAPAERAAISVGEEPDLFDSGDAQATSFRGIDGHVLSTELEMQVCNWLYLAQLVHAHQRSLPSEEPFYADFYLPERSIYIDCWDDNVPASALKAKLAKREVYKALALKVIEINADDVERLDEVLGRGLLAYGIRR